MSRHCAIEAHRTDAELARAARDRVFAAAPDQDGARGGIDRDVEAVLGTIVDEHIELQRGGDLAA